MASNTNSFLRRLCASSASSHAVPLCLGSVSLAAPLALHFKSSVFYSCQACATAGAASGCGELVERLERVSGEQRALMNACGLSGTVPAHLLLISYQHLRNEISENAERLNGMAKAAV